MKDLTCRSDTQLIITGSVLEDMNSGPSETCSFYALLPRSVDGAELPGVARLKTMLRIARFPCYATTGASLLNRHYRRR